MTLPPVTSTATPVVRGAPRPPPELTVTALRAGLQHVLVVTGEADLHTAGLLRARLLDMLRSQPPSVVVDVRALEFCDLAGLDALHDAARAAHDARVVLTFRGMSAQLSWLHRTFPPDRPAPPSTPDLTREAPGKRTSRPPTRSEDRPAAGRRARSAGPAEARRAVGPRRDDGNPAGYLTARGGGRRGFPDVLVHAVPTNDTTRSAVCGARTWPATTPWTGDAPDSCPDCAAAVVTTPSVGTVHRLSAPQTAPGVRGAQPRTRRRQVS